MVVGQSDIPLVGASAIVPLSGASATGTVGQHATAQLAAMVPLALVDSAMASLRSTTSSSGYIIVGAQTPNAVISPQTQSRSAVPSPGVSAKPSGVSAASNA